MSAICPPTPRKSRKRSRSRKSPGPRSASTSNTTSSRCTSFPKINEKSSPSSNCALKNASELILATDEDREGESIGWHLSQILKPKVPVKRMVFSEITSEAIHNAIQHTRSLDTNLVEAQETRRVLDRLYGYTLSPLLWKKIARGLSAGRVQSVAVRLLVERELERLAFRSGTYWDLAAHLRAGGRLPGQKARRIGEFTATLATVAGSRVASGKDFDESTGRLKEGVDAVLLSRDRKPTSLRDRIVSGPWRVTDVESGPQTRRPAPPFTTSTLQQEANRKLGYSAKDTMSIAQRLYENGYITYMRTDSVQLSSEAISAVRRSVKRPLRRRIFGTVRTHLRHQEPQRTGSSRSDPAGWHRNAHVRGTGPQRTRVGPLRDDLEADHRHADGRRPARL